MQALIYFLQGPSGPKGERGESGLPGPWGQQGPKGMMGDVGPPGSEVWIMFIGIFSLKKAHLCILHSMHLGYAMLTQSCLFVKFMYCTCLMYMKLLYICACISVWPLVNFVHVC